MESRHRQYGLHCHECRDLVEVLLQLLRRAYDDPSQLTPTAATTDCNDDASCDGDSCAAG